MPYQSLIIMKCRFVLFCLFTCFFIDALRAQTQTATSRRVMQFTSAQIDSAASSKRTPDKPGRLLASGPADERYLIVVRMAEGAVEVHEQYDDVAVIRAGHGVLRTGPTAEGAKLSGAAPMREWLGGSIPAAAERRIAAGDFLVIPAGLAHQYVPDSGDSLVYFTIKVRKGDLKSVKK
jgi:mannose-6-phosphate isomerase-like protein (cupin superfamily)